MAEINWIERQLYDAGGHTGSSFYIRIVRRRDGMIWDANSESMKAVASVTWVNSAIDLVEEGSTGVFPVVIPHDWRTRDTIARTDYGKAHADLTDAQRAAVNAKFDAIKNIPADTYDIIAYKMLGSIADPSDDVEKQWEAKLGGDIFGF